MIWFLMIMNSNSATILHEIAKLNLVVPFPLIVRFRHSSHTSCTFCKVTFNHWICSYFLPDWSSWFFFFLYDKGVAHTKKNLNTFMVPSKENQWNCCSLTVFQLFSKLFSISELDVLLNLKNYVDLPNVFSLHIIGIMWNVLMEKLNGRK